MVSSMEKLAKKLDQKSGKPQFKKYRQNRSPSGSSQESKERYKARSDDRSPENRKCFYCKKKGHLIKDCPNLEKKPTAKNKQVTFSDEEEKPPRARECYPKVTQEESSDDDHTDGSASVKQLGKAKMLRIQVSVNGVMSNAIIDTGAQVTILSDKIYETLTPKPSIIKETSLHAAGRDMKMLCSITEPISMKIGDMKFTQEFYIAPLDCDMLIGLDFLEKYQATINISQLTLNLNGRTLNLTYGTQLIPSVHRVTVSSRTIVPPNSVVRLTCETNAHIGNYVIDPIENQPLCIPRTVCGHGQTPEICLLNITSNNVILKKGQTIAHAEEVDVIEPLKKQGIHNLLAVTETDLELPEHIQELYEKSITDLDMHQRTALKRLLYEYSDVFAVNDFDLGNFTAIQHNIDTGDARPVKLRMRRTPACFEDEEEAHLKKMLQAGVIQPSVSEWASAPVLIRKRDGQLRWCLDYRLVNSKTIKDTFPLPLIDQCLDTLSENVWSSRLDANSAYWQIPVRPQDRKKTAFITRFGLFECVRMSFGLCNAPSTYARVMNLVLRGLTWKTVLAFLDDILVLGTDFQAHLDNLKAVFDRFRQYHLKLKPRKCDLFKKSVEFLGRKVSEKGLEISEHHLKPVKDWPVPKSTKEVERFLGFANYHRSFIKKYAKISAPLYQITGKALFRWENEQQVAFEKLKEKLTSPPVLALPNKRDHFILDTDASDKAIGAELIQVQNGNEKVIAYGSFVLTPEQRRYCTTRKELLAVIRFTRQFRHYLLGRQFTIRTDHSSLTWLLGFKEPQGQLARWMEELSQYDMVIKHRPGKYHGDADSLSRIPDTESECSNWNSEVKLKDLPCNGCRYCQRVHKNWSKFLQEVDDVVPLTKKGKTTQKSVNFVKFFEKIYIKC